jgi:hypothetical protein
MKKFNIELIRSFKPCYDPIRYIPESWVGTAIDLLDIKKIPFHDRLWVLMRTDFVSEKLIRLFSVWCARQVQHLMKDERSIKALDVSESFANGIATTDDLAAARAAAWAAASDAAWDAAWAAASDAAWAAASDAAWAAASDAAWAAAWAAASDAAWDAAWAAASDGDAQENKLREMILAGVAAGDTK